MRRRVLSALASLSVSLLLAAGPSFAEPKLLASKEEVRAALAQFIQKIAADDVDGAFGVFAPYVPFDGEELTALKLEAARQRKAMKPRYGGSLGGFLVSEEAIGDVLVRYTYLEKLERHVIRWIFTFYKPREGWMVNSILFDDNAQAALAS
jgi:hypothetical protein